MSLKSVLAKINKARDDYIKEREKRAERELARLKTKTAREKERAKLSIARNKARAEANRARASALRAEADRKRAARELREQGFVGRMMRSLAGTGQTKSTRKRRRSRR